MRSQILFARGLGERLGGRAYGDVTEDIAQTVSDRVRSEQRTYRALQVLLVAVAAFGLCACSFKIQEPATDIAIPSGTKTKVTVGANATFTLTQLTADGNDVTGQMIAKGSYAYEGNLNLALGKTHTLVAKGDVYCGYCTGQKWTMTDTKTFCVAEPVSHRCP